jgi:SAM-dependent MidA family methyltransferase
MPNLDEIDPERPETWPVAAREYLARHQPPAPDTRLTDALREEIRASGPISFARFMEHALYDPGHGYYAVAEGRVGRAGDFVTSPTLHPAFGALLCRRIARRWEQLGRPDPFVVAEAGGGTGALAEQILRAATAATASGPPCLSVVPEPLAFAAALRYRLIEPFAVWRAAQERRLAAWSERLAWHASLEEQPRPPHLLLANELLDALPAHRVVRRAVGLCELYVALDARGELVEQEGPLSTAELTQYFTRLGLQPPLDTPAEVNLAALAWLKGAMTATRGGWIWLLDYGAEARELYAAPRAGTLRAFYDHALHTDWLARVGAQDLTSDVDFTTLIGASQAEGWEVEEFTTQRELLLSLGWREYLQMRRSEHASRTDPSAPSAGRWALLQLIDPRGLGAVRSLLLRDRSEQAH